VLHAEFSTLHCILSLVPSGQVKGFVGFWEKVLSYFENMASPRNKCTINNQYTFVFQCFFKNWGKNIFGQCLCR
jgi:hypothetical protein